MGCRDHYRLNGPNRVRVNLASGVQIVADLDNTALALVYNGKSVESTARTTFNPDMLEP
jgi:hypothetical protein